MSDLKKMISDFVQTNYSEISNKEKNLLNKVALVKILRLDYYKNRYNTVSIATFNKKDYFCTTNSYDLISSSNIDAKMHMDNGSYSLDSEDYDSMKEIIISHDIFNRITKFKDIIHQSTSQKEYVDVLSQEHIKDPDFIPTIFSFSFLFKDFNYNFFDDSIKALLNKENITDIISENLKKEVYLTSQIDWKNLNSDTINNFKRKWNDNHHSRIDSIEKGYKKLSNIQKYEKKYNKKIKSIIEYISQEKVFLFKPVNIQDVSFHYYEISNNNEDAGWNEGKKFFLKQDLEFDEHILNKHGIDKSEIYKIDFNNTIDYQEMKNLIRPYIINYDNELNNSFKGAFYGLDYIDSAIKGNICERSYIIAKYHNETVGMISFRSEENINQSVVKNIEYVCVKDSFRGTGLASVLYQKLANIFIDNNKILINSMYSKQGSIKLPRLKEEIRNKNPSFLFIDKDIGKNQDNQDFNRIFLREFNNYFIDKILYIERKKEFHLNDCVSFLNNFYRTTVEQAKSDFDNINANEYRLYSRDKISESMEKLQCEIEKINLNSHLNSSSKNVKPKI